ncbi:MAG: hypothetical protein HC880_18190 [Bacteroidia bacterium]|nr:hypothetical protein [Bacteroidia bacterium]
MKGNNPEQIARRSTSQERRFSRALDFNYVKIDERSFRDLLLFTAEFSKFIHFYNLKDEIDGDWSEFLQDELVILATMADLETGRIAEQFKKHFDQAQLFRRPEKKTYYLQKCFEEIYRLAQLFDRWALKFKEVEQFTNIQMEARNELLHAISTTLGEALQRLKDYDENAQHDPVLQHKIGLNYSSFSPFWGLKPASPYQYLGDNLNEKIRYLLFDLQKVFQIFYEMLIYIKNRAAVYFQQSLQTDNHYPEVALLLAFLKLYQIPQDYLNQLSERYLEFYYRSVLKQENKPQVHDQAYLRFETNDNAPFAEIQPGTRFIGGEYENGENIIYASNEYLQVNKAQITRLITFFVEKRNLNIRGHQKPLVTNILSAELPLAELLPQRNKAEQKSYPIFGESQFNKSIYEKTMNNALLGFAVASPSLFLSEGKREISLTFQFSSDSFKHLSQYLEDLSFVNNDSRTEVFIKSFLEAFNIRLTSANGWYTISRYVVTREKSNSQDDKPNALRLSFDLDPSEPAVVSFDPKLHPGDFKTDMPLICVHLNSDSYVYAYSLLQALELQQIFIDTRVTGVKDLMLYSEIGVLSPDNPFYPFGSIPHLGSYLLIGKNEVFQKSLNELEIDIEWFNLPKLKSGFQGYYEDYELDIDNNTFEVKLSILDEGRWKPLKTKDQQSFHLFQTIKNDYSLREESNDDKKPKNGDGNGNGNGNTQAGGMLSDETHIHNVDIIRIKLPHHFSAISQRLEYSNTTQRGFIKLELSGPEYAFAHSIYPSVLSTVVMDNSRDNLVESAKRGFGKKDRKRMPNPPYTPQIKAISINYSSSSVISLHDRSVKNENITTVGSFFIFIPMGKTWFTPTTLNKSLISCPS